MSTQFDQPSSPAKHWARLFNAQRLGSNKKPPLKTARAHPFIRIMTDWYFRTPFGSSIKRPKFIH